MNSIPLCVLWDRLPIADVLEPLQWRVEEYVGLQSIFIDVCPFGCCSADMKSAVVCNVLGVGSGCGLHSMFVRLAEHIWCTELVPVGLYLQLFTVVDTD